ncbi:hypothetical protein QO206_02930 [Leeuwenhoekiella aequorea]|uniref:hypothetical protein n=1 Tax=Leeuwenhoekiella aequorea TaxID=283736 RepID=UPI00352E489A
MNKKQLAELLKYCSPNQLYVVTWNNILKLLFCPFKVKAKYDIGDLKYGEQYWVREVKVTLKLKTVFVIGDKGYHYNHFDILIDD